MTEQTPASNTPSFGLPPETPIMPGTTDHHIDPTDAPADTQPPQPQQTDTAQTASAMPGVIMPQHDTTPDNDTSAPAFAPTPTPTPAAKIPAPADAALAHEPVAQPQPRPQPTPIPPLVAAPQAQPSAVTPSKPITPITETTDTLPHPAASRAFYEKPHDEDIVPKGQTTHTTPAAGSLPPLPPRRMSAQDMLYQSPAGKPLDGPVIPSTRPELPNMPPPPPPTPTPSYTSPSTAAGIIVPPTAQTTQVPARQSAIRTLESDVATTVAQNRLTVGGIALAQYAKNDSVIVGAEEKKFSWWAVGGILLALLGVGIVTVAYIMQTRAPETEPVVITTQDALIPGVVETTLDITDMTRASVLRSLSELAPKYAGTEGISLVRLIAYREDIIESETVRIQVDVPPETFFTQISAHAPARLARTLGKQTYFGVVTISGRTIPFLALETSSYDSAFAGMLEWEPFIPADLSFLTHTPAPILPEPTASTTASSSDATTATTTPSASTTASTTPTATSTTTPAVAPTPVIATPPVFVDITVKNHDARAVRNADGTTHMLYAFPTPTMLLIAQDEQALSALVDHLNIARFSR